MENYPKRFIDTKSRVLVNVFEYDGEFNIFSPVCSWRMSKEDLNHLIEIGRFVPDTEDIFVLTDPTHATIVFIDKQNCYNVLRRRIEFIVGVSEEHFFKVEVNGGPSRTTMDDVGFNTGKHVCLRFTDLGIKLEIYADKYELDVLLPIMDLTYFTKEDLIKELL